jgi:para-aminobenzoate synthetase/4-amino-4-deoxychorismate lyase
VPLPETYLSVAAGRVSSSPIKGTRPAGEGRALAESAKDTSENVMIVDLVRNDLARVCEPGSVGVDELLAVRPHAGVAHLVSQVGGRLRPGVGAGALVVGTFPPGSVIGTPKQRAGEVTDQVEAAARGAHTGAAGFLGGGLADLAVTIRTLEVGPDGAAALGVGGGIVADSTPAEEWHEVLTKAAPLLGALGLPPVRPSPSTAASKGLADPSAGLLETVLAVDGRAVAGADHVARLRRSAWELTGRGLTADVEGLLVGTAARAGSGAHRVRVRCGLPSLEVSVQVEPWQAPVAPAGQRGLVLGLLDAPPAGLERHKYADRRYLEQALARSGTGAGAVDDAAFQAPDGLLETTRACLLAVVDGPDGPGLVTPPLDGRLLPGTTRQVLVDLALQRGWWVRLAGLDTQVLAAADGLIACNALRGAQWVARVGEHRWDAPAPALSTLAQALLRRWRLPAG